MILKFSKDEWFTDAADANAAVVVVSPCTRRDALATWFRRPARSRRHRSKTGLTESVLRSTYACLGRDRKVNEAPVRRPVVNSDQRCVVCSSSATSNPASFDGLMDETAYGAFAASA